MHLPEHRLQDAVERVLRGGARPGWAVLALHLARLGEPEGLHRQRQATATLLHEVAVRTEGQLFLLGAGDLVLLFRPADQGAGVSDLVARLFQAEAMDTAALQSLWFLPGATQPVRRYMVACLAERHRVVPPIQAAGPVPAFQRQTAIRVHGGREPRVEPLFREFTAAGSATRPMLEAAAREAVAGAGRVPIHLNLMPEEVLAHPLAALAGALAQAKGPPIGIEVPFAAVFTAPDAFRLAQARLRLAGMALVLDGVTHHVFQASRADVLQPALLKLTWSDAMARAGPGLAEAVRAFGAERLVLTGCTSDRGLLWGLGLGVQRFQGPFADTLLPARALGQAA